ncbi:hypothetical protein STEG23_023080, partial [Scotinomys teguina]
KKKSYFPRCSWGGKRLRSSSSSSWAGLLTAIVSTGYAASQCMSARPPGGAPTLI